LQHPLLCQLLTGIPGLTGIPELLLVVMAPLLLLLLLLRVLQLRCCIPTHQQQSLDVQI